MAIETQAKTLTVDREKLDALKNALTGVYCQFESYRGEIDDNAMFRALDEACGLLGELLGKEGGAS